MESKSFDFSFLFANGYQVIPGVLSEEKANYYKVKLYDLMNSHMRMNEPQNEDMPLDQIDFNELNFETCRTRVAWGGSTRSSIFQYYGEGTNQTLVDCRSEVSILEVFAHLHGVKIDTLLSSWDAYSVEKLTRYSKPRLEEWMHIDVSYKTFMSWKPEEKHVQGFVTMLPMTADDCPLMVIPGSHLLTKEFFDANPEKKEIKSDFVKIGSLDFFSAKPIAVEAQAGDLVLWNSNLAHCKGSFGRDAVNNRALIYTCYYPRPKDGIPENQLIKNNLEFGNTTRSHNPLPGRSHKFPFNPQHGKKFKKVDRKIELNEKQKKLFALIN
jgi:hypothetical protein